MNGEDTAGILMGVFIAFLCAIFVFSFFFPISIGALEYNNVLERVGAYIAGWILYWILVAIFTIFFKAVVWLYKAVVGWVFDRITMYKINKAMKR